LQLPAVWVAAEPDEAPPLSQVSGKQHQHPAVCTTKRYHHEGASCCTKSRPLCCTSTHLHVFIYIYMPESAAGGCGV
jgi:hypothetical protein